MPTSICKACARLMKEKTDFPRGNFDSDYCVDCVDSKGNLKPREIIRVNMIRYRVNNTGISQEEAAEIVDNLMRSLPAWNPPKVKTT
ncbi:MAG: zinc ribbon domain-containing protein [Candidatus Zixiibacteriota bacterium]